MATVDRVLPWRRHTPSPSDEISPLLHAYRARHPRAPVNRIMRAYEMAEHAHRDQYRKSGERYINHPLAVARIVTDLGLDDVTVAAALLHDAVEDTDLTLADVEREFGKEVAGIVDGVTKLERIRFDSKEEQQAATMRKMLVAMAKDGRVLIIKLSDRLHNMRTIAGIPAEKQRRIAQETLDIYAPLAHRLGMQEMKQQLEDLSFAALHPKRYAELDHLVSTRTPERQEYLAAVIEQVRRALADLKIHAEVTGRPKHLWSIYEKMVVKGKEFDEIFDLVGIRVIVETQKDCWAALGSIHTMWKPVFGRFKDYINMPKFNAYRSLHTTVIGPAGKPVEVQIRTRAMHQQAEYGVAAHWSYKEGGSPDDIQWLNRMVDWQQEVHDPATFMENLRTDLLLDEVYVFTPKGKVIALPAGATPIDFAYAVHTEVGHACIGAKVNDRLVPLDTRLSSGDTCEIVTARVDARGPSQDWLQIVVSPRARNKIRQWFSRSRREDAIESGKEELTRALRREGLPLKKILGSDLLAKEAERLGLADVEALYAAIGSNQVSGTSVASRIGRQLRDGEAEEIIPATARAPRRPSKRKQNAGVHVEGLDDVMVRLARCCTPVPGDGIIGFVTRGRGVSVHRADCANAVALASAQQARLIDVEWDNDHEQTMFVAAIEVKALDRSRLLRDVANSLSEQHVNIVACSTHTGTDRVSKMRFEFELADPAHLDAVIRVIKNIDSVYDAYRVVPGGGRAAQRS